MHHLLYDIGIAITVATVVGLIFHFLKQPIILGYLVAGIIIGPSFGPALVNDPENIEVISEIGLILLLFIIGLEMNLQKILSAGKAMLVAGIGQFFLTVLMGVGFFTVLGYSLGPDSMDALYLALFCGLSSTAIVVKILYDKFELDTMAGRITLGILIFQDIWAILVLSIQPNFTDPDLMLVAWALLKGVGLMAMGFLLSRFMLKPIFERINRAPEMMVATSIAWCAAVAFAAGAVGLSMEMGGLIAGLAISSFPYSTHVSAKVLPLRDFFLTLFFISLGMKIPEPYWAIVTGALWIVFFVFLSRFLTIYPLLAMLKSSRRTSFIVSLNLAQVGEFSLVIAMLGVSYGHIGDEILALILYAMAITSVVSSYLIKGNHQLFLLYDKFMCKIGLEEAREPVISTDEIDDHPVIILGYHRGAAALVKELQRLEPEMLGKLSVIDFNLEVLKRVRVKGMKGVFGDISSVDTMIHAKIESAKIILSTIPDMLLKGTSNVAIVRMCRSLAPEAVIIATAETSAQELEVRNAGANEIVRPYYFIGRQLADYLIENPKLRE